MATRPRPRRIGSTANRASQPSNLISYTAAGGGQVCITLPINPWIILGLDSARSSRGDVKTAFKNRIAQSQRQSRALVSLANHILTSTSPRYLRHPGTNLYSIQNRDHFIVAAYGNTKELEVMIKKNKSLVEVADEHGRSLLYLASKSGFYDMCKMLLQNGAAINQVQRDGSTPLHGAAFFGHALVVGLLLEFGARIDIANNWGQTPFQEGASDEIRNAIQKAPSDVISTLAGKLTKDQLVSRVKLIEFKGQVIGKELFRHPQSFDEGTRRKVEKISQSWELTWHGTRFRNIESILRNGLLPAGTRGIKPPPNHYSLGKEYFGVKNWAAAIFLSPSMAYSSHAAYAERISSQSKQWCVLIKVYCRPDSYKAYDPTVFSYKPMDGEPGFPEFRVPVSGKDKNVILRVESSRSVVVRSVVFIRPHVLEEGDVNFQETLQLFKE